jgi:hypothetical protein
LFDVQLPNHRQQLDSIYGWQVVKNVNVNKTSQPMLGHTTSHAMSHATSRHLISHLQNCPIIINYVVDRDALSGVVGDVAHRTI